MTTEQKTRWIRILGLIAIGVSAGLEAITRELQKEQPQFAAPPTGRVWTNPEGLP